MNCPKGVAAKELKPLNGRCAAASYHGGFATMLSDAESLRSELEEMRFAEQVQREASR